MVHAFPALPVPMVLLLVLAKAVRLAHSVTRRARWSATNAPCARHQILTCRRSVPTALSVPMLLLIIQVPAKAVHPGISVTRRARWGATRAPRAQHRLLIWLQCATQYLLRALLHLHQSRPSLFRPQYLQLWLPQQHQACPSPQLLQPARQRPVPLLPLPRAR